MKRANTYKGRTSFEQSEFDHYYACWANNHRGWAKIKKANRRKAKRKMSQEWREELSIKQESDEDSEKG